MLSGWTRDVHLASCPCRLRSRARQRATHGWFNRALPSPIVRDLVFFFGWQGSNPDVLRIFLPSRISHSGIRLDVKISLLKNLIGLAMCSNEHIQSVQGVCVSVEIPMLVEVGTRLGSLEITAFSVRANGRGIVRGETCGRRIPQVS